MLIFSALSTSQLRSDELKCQCNSQILIAQLLIPCFMETKGRNCRGYRNVFNPSNKKPSSPGVPTRLKFARIILNQQPTASRLLHHMIAKLLESNGWFQHEAFIWPKSDCSYLICFRKKTHFSPHITTHITRISSCSNCSEFCKNDLQHKRCSVQLCVCVQFEHLSGFLQTKKIWVQNLPLCRELSYPNQWKLDIHFPKFL